MLKGRLKGPSNVLPLGPADGKLDLEAAQGVDRLPQSFDAWLKTHRASSQFPQMILVDQPFSSKRAYYPPYLLAPNHLPPCLPPRQIVEPVWRQPTSQPQC